MLTVAADVLGVEILGVPVIFVEQDLPIRVESDTQDGSKIRIPSSLATNI
jgi:hypothetical protein